MTNSNGKKIKANANTKAKSKSKTNANTKATSKKSGAKSKQTVKKNSKETSTKTSKQISKKTSKEPSKQNDTKNSKYVKTVSELLKMKNMLLQTFLKEMTYRKNGAVHFKFDPAEGELSWRGKKATGAPVMLKTPMTLSKTKVSKLDDGNRVVLTNLKNDTAYITVNTGGFNATIKVSHQKEMTLNQCIRKCAYLIRFIAAKQWWHIGFGSDTPTIKEFIRLHVLNSYRVNGPYFIIDL